jgi:hypothetical protein
LSKSFIPQPSETIFIGVHTKIFYQRAERGGGMLNTELTTGGGREVLNAGKQCGGGAWRPGGGGNDVLKCCELGLGKYGPPPTNLGIWGGMELCGRHGP